MRPIVFFVAALLGVALAATPSTAEEGRVLLVGPDQPLHSPSEAARAVHDGDTVKIEPGEYFDCAAWSANHLTIEGMGAGVVITDRTCQGKALFITRGQDITIRNITFARARVPDGNGAGIRGEGGDLTVEGSTFTNNEVAILVGDIPGAAVRITGSVFTGNGRCRDAHCLGTVMVGEIGTLRINNATFQGDTGGDIVVSHAHASHLSGNSFKDTATQAHLLSFADVADLSVDHNSLETGPSIKSNPRAAIFLGFSRFDNGTLSFSHNHVSDSGRGGLTFVLNWTGNSVRFDDNTFTGDISETSSSGRVSHWLYYDFLKFKDGIRHIVGSVLRALHLTR